MRFAKGHYTSSKPRCGVEDENGGSKVGEFHLSYVHSAIFYLFRDKKKKNAAKAIFSQELDREKTKNFIFEIYNLDRKVFQKLYSLDLNELSSNRVMKQCKGSFLFVRIVVSLDARNGTAHTQFFKYVHKSAVKKLTSPFNTRGILSNDIAPTHDNTPLSNCLTVATIFHYLT